MTETRLLQKVRAFHKRYFSFWVNNQDFMEPEQTKSKWFVIEPLTVTVLKTSGDQVDIPGKRDHEVYTPSLQILPPGIRSMEKIGHLVTCTRLVEGVFIPGRFQARGRKEKDIKNGDPHRNGDLSLKS